jgi:hypothetical protein
MTRTYNTLRVGSEIVTEIAGEQPDVVGCLLFIISFFSSIFAISSSSSSVLFLM